MSNIKVITIKQPFASLILKGYKEYEFRTWPTKYRGEILIHAGKTVDKEAIATRFKEYDLGNMPTGVIIAKVNITDCIKMTNEFAYELYNKDENVYNKLKNWNGYAWKIEKVEKLEQYIPIKGQLGLWNYDLK